MESHLIEQEIENAHLTITRRLRRNRKSSAIRSLSKETRLHPSDFVAPIFLLEGRGIKEEVSSMPGVYRYTIDQAIEEIKELYDAGIRAVDLFPVVPSERKDSFGSEAIRSDNLVLRAIERIKSKVPQMCVMVDIALDPYTDHGHDGLINSEGIVINDLTVRLLAKMSLLAAQAGADVVAPSDMMDGRVAHIRQCLDEKGYENTSILSYGAKYASSLYGPFRDGIGSSLKIGDKQTYQMDPANIREALLECSVDEWEGADMLMVKPALAYLDVITKLREQSDLPVAAYQVSGEYAMIMAAAAKGWLDADKVIMETLLSIKRAGASIIFTYAAKRAAAMINT
ncbi:Delta-aminolevulinic acid dehydratase [Waddlia chondrophila 2032/99]|uniref:Delta-aminolevulinic acid dehydratase n=2 Tax=Waddlia chondrophila TaxID=71667 RepID=D6YTF4_WADCW|nr:porphobilinogen synthase [Waddlia chondrophila]ADI37415.1 Delta-aminolevulinic acid dehydratase [Waddlia chondrophila WSU 86-1044]CCB90829.1 Delta-aminolevulinic acid dehydratase [Waddlia chondrophila 2032/99]